MQQWRAVKQGKAGHGGASERSLLEQKGNSSFEITAGSTMCTTLFLELDLRRSCHKAKLAETDSNCYGSYRTSLLVRPALQPCPWQSCCFSLLPKHNQRVPCRESGAVQALSQHMTCRWPFRRREQTSRIKKKR